MKTMSTLFFLFKTRDVKKPQWPSCNNPKTLSFREASAANDDEMFKTVNSVFLDPLSAAEAAAAAAGVEVETPESLFTNSAESTSLSTESFEDSGRAEPMESVISRVVRSDRMFFEPAGNTKFILEEEEEEDLEEAKNTTTATTKGARGGVFRFIKESVALAIESEDPYADFKNSMEEMVESHGLKDWECLEELLGWYLTMNAKSSHGFIIGAFVDLLVSISPSSSSSTSNCISESITSYYSSAISSLSSPSSPSCSSSRGEKDEIGVIDKQTRINSR